VRVLPYKSNRLPSIRSQARLVVKNANCVFDITPAFQYPRKQSSLLAPLHKLKYPFGGVLIWWRWGELNPRPGFGPMNFYLDSRFGISPEAKKPTK